MFEQWRKNGSEKNIKTVNSRTVTIIPRQEKIQKKAKNISNIGGEKAVRLQALQNSNIKIRINNTIHIKTVKEVIVSVFNSQWSDSLSFLTVNGKQVYSHYYG